MKKQLLAVLAAALIFSGCERENTQSAENEAAGGSASAAETVSEQSETSAVSEKKREDIMSENGIEYTVFDGKATLKAYTGGGTAVDIPDNIGGYPVKTIVSNFFKNSGITEVTLPESITEAGTWYMKDIKIINLTSADDFRFNSIRDMTSVEEVNILNEGEYKSVDGVVYTSDCKKLVYYPPARTGGFEIPEGVEEICDWAFSKSKISSITLSEGLSVIGEYAFSQCKNIDSVTTPFSLREIGDYAFSSSGLREVKIRNGLESIGRGAFRDTRIQEIYLPDSVENCGLYIFSIDDNNVYISAGTPTEGMVNLGTEYKNVDFRNETLLQKAVRKAGNIGEYINGRIFVDLNFDSFPEMVEFCGYYNQLCSFDAENGNWSSEAIIGDKLYLYRDEESGERFYFFMGYSDYDGSAIAEKLKIYGGGGAKFSEKFMGWTDSYSCGKCGKVVSFQHINGVFELGEFDGYSEKINEFFYSTVEKGLAEYTLERVIDFDELTADIDKSQKFDIVMEEFADEPKDNGLPEYVDDENRNWWVPNYQASINADEMTEEAFAKLAENKKITYLSISFWNEKGEAAVSADFSGIGKLENLKELRIYGSPKNTGIINAAEIGKLKNLEVLYISAELENYDFLSELDSLKVIEFSGTEDKPADFFKPIYGMKELRYLLVSTWERSITDEQLDELEKNMPQLCICGYKRG